MTPPLSLRRRLDTDNSGFLDHAEFKSALLRLGLNFSKKQVSLIILDLDQDGDGCVSIHEFLNKMYDCKLANLRRKLCASAYARGEHQY